MTATTIWTSNSSQSIPLVAVEIPTGNPLEVDLGDDLKPVAARYLDTARAAELPPLPGASA